MNWVEKWWRQPDHFDWLSGYLQTRGMATPMRRGLAVVAASLALVPANALWGPASIDDRIAVALAVVAALAGLSLAVLWLKRWPTRTESMVFAAIGSATIAGGCLWQAEPLIGLMSCTALAVSGGYIAFFHTARYMLVNFVLAMAVGAWQAVRVAAEGELVLALTGYFLVLELNVGVPFAIQVIVRSLGTDLLRSDRDPLTGLLNRRAFTSAVVGRLVARSDKAYLAVALIDLDRFKAINDVHGHASGDAALVDVSEALTAACAETALLCRMGGEEFLIADIVAAAVPTEWAKGLCAAVHSTPFRMTASVGTATVPLRDVRPEQADQTFQRLVTEADAAMYAAKRRGGNQVQHAGETRAAT
ncbi:sensor domain-containing diguanylate cyclase [Mycolicibacterium litorale]|uniref:GGDEF domain-containing protein n=1 Tax=Mycolicibacterium litorale TaxID=758802 RepID=UPI0016234E7F|nr:GGDEF domain-containing protein [Mycolicibacterium litorale]